MKCAFGKHVLRTHPIFYKSGAMYCLTHGDFFPVKNPGGEIEWIFRAYEKPEKLPKISHRRIVVRCDQTGTVFSNLSQACTAMNLSRPSLTAHLKGRHSHVGGYTFTRVEDLNEDSDLALPKSSPRRVGGRPAIHVLWVETAQTFPSVRKAAESTGVSKTQLVRHLKWPDKYPSLAGKTFRIKDLVG